MAARDQRGDPLSPHLEAIRLGAIIIPPVVSHVPTRCQARVASMQRPTPTSLMLRRMTASAVLDALRAGGPMTGSDLMDATGLARPTIHVICNDLIRLGWIRETDSRRPAGEPLAHVSVPVAERVAAIRRATDAALASAAVEPARVLAVTVGVPTPVGA